MSEKDLTVTRRDILKVGGLVAAMTALSACGIATGRSESERETLRAERGGFVEIPNGSAIVLTDTKGNEAVINVSYGGDIVPMQMRGDRYQVDKELNAFRYEPEPFSPGQEVRRYTGEILEMKMYDLVANPNLPDGESVQARPTPYGSPLRPATIGKGERLQGIPVLTGFEKIAWLPEGDQWEINPTQRNDTNEHKKWAPGWLVGELWASQSESGEGITSFRAIGYVHRNELLVPMSETSEG